MPFGQTRSEVAPGGSPSRRDSTRGPPVSKKKREKPRAPSIAALREPIRVVARTRVREKKRGREEPGKGALGGGATDPNRNASAGFAGGRKGPARDAPQGLLSLPSCGQAARIFRASPGETRAMIRKPIPGSSSGSGRMPAGEPEEPASAEGGSQFDRRVGGCPVCPGGSRGERKEPRERRTSEPALLRLTKRREAHGRSPGGSRGMRGLPDDREASLRFVTRRVRIHAWIRWRSDTARAEKTW
jgi:hypothetical protein